MPLVLVAVVITGAILARTVHGGRWRQATWDMRAHLSGGWTIIVLGLVHIGATWLLYVELSNRALWFASGGIAMALGGAVNLLQRLYAASAPGISPVCLVANVALTLLASLFVTLAGARVVREPQFLLLLGLLAGCTWLSVAAARVPRSNL
jgi:hypothetical protein